MCVNCNRCFALCLLLFFTTEDVIAQLDFERAPILYSKSTPTDPVAKLTTKLDSGEAQLHWEPDHGYLKSLLKLLSIPPDSQTLVYSKTSLQVGRISPRTPRAIYFNDDVYVGWVQRGDLIEISAADSALGATFYTLSQKPAESPLPKRETSRCLHCHASTHTRRIPGHIVRSVYADTTGQPVYRLGTHLTDNRSPFAERWGGWYVTGTHGNQKHLGNMLIEDPDTEDFPEPTDGNVTRLEELLNTKPYLTPHSDIVALMVLQHQTRMHNVLTAANHSGRRTALDATVMNELLERESDHVSDATKRRYQSAAEKVVRALLFCDEVRLTEKVQGTSLFAEQFSARGPFDAGGHSLRQLDLTRRLFRFPCSFLIYSEAFQSLPEGVLTRVKSRLREVLSGDDTSDEFSHLDAADREAILRILTETDVL